MRTISQDKFDALKRLFAEGASIRIAMRETGVGKHTALRYQRMFHHKPLPTMPSRKGMGLIVGEGCRRATQAERQAIWESKEGPLPFGKRLGSLCTNPYCWNVEHMCLVDHLGCGRTRYTEFVEAVATLKLGEAVEFPDYPNSEKEVVKLVSALRQNTRTQQIRLSVRSYQGPVHGIGLRLIHAGLWGSAVRGIEPSFIDTSQIPVLKNPRRVTPEERERRILLAQKLRAERRRIRMARVFERHMKLGISPIWLGQFRQTPQDEALLALPRVGRCSEPACPFPHNGSDKCRYHEHFFDLKWSMEWRQIDRSDIYGTEDNPEPLFSTLQGWELERSAERTVFEYRGQKNRGQITSDEYWRKAVEALNAAKNSLAPGQNVQHTGAFVLWKGFGKKKIRKSQRRRAAGWHGNHPEQMPRKRYTRETLDELPQWAPPRREYPVAADDEESYTSLYETWEANLSGVLRVSQEGAEDQGEK